MILRVMLAGVAFAAFFLPAQARACSCRDGPSDLGENLRQARDKASAIYLARVLSVDEGFDDAKASVEVLETLKGSLKVGSKLTVPAGGGGDCTFPFKARKAYVMFARGDPSSVGLCSRTREITSIKGDTELCARRSIVNT